MTTRCKVTRRLSRTKLVDQIMARWEGLPFGSLMITEPFYQTFNRFAQDAIRHAYGFVNEASVDLEHDQVTLSFTNEEDAVWFILALL